jgi:ABC-type transport system involved in multi-copper enzyme maturation permease subunit
MNLLNVLRMASMTAEESLRKKILYLILFLSVILVAGSNFVNVFNLGAQVRLIKDFSLTGINFFGLIFTLALYLNAVPREIEAKTIYPLLTRPLKRSEYLWGKFLGNYFLVFLNMAILALELFFILKLNSRISYYSIFPCVFLYFLQCGIVGAMLLFFSIRLSPPMSLSLAVFLFIIGSLSAVYIQYLAAQAQGGTGVFFIKLIKDILPHFDYFDIKNSVVHDYIIDPRYLPAASLYGAAYIWLLLLLGESSLRRKDL